MLQRFKVAVSKVLMDDGFQLPSKPAQTALKSAEGVLNGYQTNLRQLQYSICGHPN